MFWAGIILIIVVLNLTKKLESLNIMILSKSKMTVEELVTLIKEVDNTDLGECFGEDFGLLAEQVEKSKVKGKSKLSKFLEEWGEEIDEHFSIGS